MSEELNRQLMKAVENGNIDGVTAAIDAGADVNAFVNGFLPLAVAAGNNSRNALTIVKHLVERGANVNSDGRARALTPAVANTNPDAFAIVRYLVKKGADVNENKEGWVLRYAAGSKNPKALSIVKYLVECGANIHARGSLHRTAVKAALISGNNDIADYLLSNDNFLPSDFIPGSQMMPLDTYRAFREKAMARICKLVDAKGLEYAREVAADIEAILKNDDPEATQGDIEAFAPVVSKIASLDWMNDAQVTSDEFLSFETSR